MTRVLHWVLPCGIALWICSTAQAEYPPTVNWSEQQPPTAKEWEEWAQRRAARQAGCHTCLKPDWRFRSVYYFEPAPCTCGSATHASFKGCYGIRHPLPYYIANEPEACAQTAVPAARKCHRCRALTDNAATPSTDTRVESVDSKADVSASSEVLLEQKPAIPAAEPAPRSP